METFSVRLAEAMEKREVSRTQLANRANVGTSAIAKWLSGRLMPRSEQLFAVAQALGTSMEWLMGGQMETPISDSPECSVSERTRRIPIVSWAHAGDPTNYEELPEDWREQVPTDCRDPRAFAVSLEGDSMEPKFTDGDLLVLMPDTEAHSGSFAVCRFAESGSVLFRRVEFTDGRVQLTPLNDRYEATRHERSAFAWIYPVWGRWTQLWKR